jgi:hypothetical protein
MATRLKAGRVKLPTKGGVVISKGPISKTGLEDGLFTPAIHWHEFGESAATSKLCLPTSLIDTFTFE